MQVRQPQSRLVAPQGGFPMVKLPNPLHPRHLTPMERRRELCRLLALGLVRLRMRTATGDEHETGGIPLHSPPDQCRHATPTHRRDA